MIQELASEKSFLDSNSKVLLISGYFSCQSTSEQNILMCLVFDLPTPKNLFICGMLCKALSKSKAAMACSCWGLQAGKIFRGCTFLLYFLTKKKRRHFFYYKSAYEVQGFNHIQMAKYQIPPWNIILCQNHTNLHFLVFFFKKNLSFSLTSVRLGLRPQAM